MTSSETNTYVSILLLSICFALSASTSSLSVSASSLVGFQIANNKALATISRSSDRTSSRISLWMLRRWNNFGQRRNIDRYAPAGSAAMEDLPAQHQHNRNQQQARQQLQTQQRPRQQR